MACCQRSARLQKGLFVILYDDVLIHIYLCINFEYLITEST